MGMPTYRPNAEKVAAELIDGEAIIINVETGCYYNTEGLGGWAWERCADGMSVEAMVKRGCAEYLVSAETLQGDLMEYFHSLKNEELVVDAGTETATTVGRDDDRDAAAGQLPYNKPKLVAYRDLKDLLALDPPMPKLGGVGTPTTTSVRR